jgi:hypothetical protein
VNPILQGGKHVVLLHGVNAFLSGLRRFSTGLRYFKSGIHLDCRPFLTEFHVFSHSPHPLLADLNLSLNFLLIVLQSSVYFDHTLLFGIHVEGERTYLGFVFVFVGLYFRQLTFHHLFHFCKLMISLSTVVSNPTISQLNPVPHFWHQVSRVE